jgi:hypothetical protein
MPWIFDDRGEQPDTLSPLDVGAVATLLAGLLDGPVAMPAAAAIHAATGGDLRRLRALTSQAWLTECMERYDGLWRVGQVTRDTSSAVWVDHLEAQRITSAAWSAWRKLAMERTDQLCRLALARGVREAIAPIWAMLLVLGGRAAEAVSFLGSLPGGHVRTTPRAALVMALALALGAGRREEASGFLRQAAAATGSQFLVAAWAWILAMAGEPGAAVAVLAATEHDGPETATFVHATRGTLARADGRADDAVVHFRDALAFAQSASSDWPWLRPLLRAALIDGLMLSGRTADATSMTQRFHAREQGSGWELALAMETLLIPAVALSSGCAAA